MQKDEKVKVMKRFQSLNWYPYAVALCISVILYVILMHLPVVARSLRSFGNYFNTVVVGCIIAYLMNPLAKLYERKLFGNIKRGRWAVSVFLAFFTFAAAIVALILVLVPQLVNSIKSFMDQLPEYQDYIHSLFMKFGLTEYIYIPESANEALNQFREWLKGYGNDIIAFWSGVIKLLIRLAIGAVLAIYLLIAKSKLKADGKELLSSLLPDNRLNRVLDYIRRCDYIVNRYLVFSLLDSLIVGGINAIIMFFLRMPYVGLVSIIVCVTNLIPTFGPVIGGIIGALLLLLENPIYAVMFIIITLILQICDGYIIKPKLFGNTLGVSGLLILLAIVTLGNTFGMGGLILAIPIAAICDFTYREELLPYLKKRKSQKLTEGS